MKQSEPQNLFELEGLEQRILLSGDLFLGAISAGLPDEPDPLFDADSGLPSVEEVQLSDHDCLQNTSPQGSDPYNPSDELVDIFAGLENQSAEESDEDIPEDQLDIDPVSSESCLGLLANSNISVVQKAAIINGLGALADFGDLLEDFSDFAVFLPIIKDSSVGSLLGLYDILDTRLKTPVFDYFNNSLDPPTTDGFTDALQEISGIVDDIDVTISALTGGYNVE